MEESRLLRLPHQNRINSHNTIIYSLIKIFQDFFFTKSAHKLTNTKIAMKNTIKIAALALIVTAAIGINKASAQASATASASATIVTPITISKTVDINFGNAAVSASAGGTVVL